MRWYASHVTCSTKDAAQENHKTHCERRVSHFQYEISATAWIYPPLDTVCNDSAISTPNGVVRRATGWAVRRNDIWRCIIIQLVHVSIPLASKHFRLMWLSLLFHMYFLLSPILLFRDIQKEMCFRELSSRMKVRNSLFWSIHHEHYTPTIHRVLAYKTLSTLLIWCIMLLNPLNNLIKLTLLSSSHIFRNCGTETPKFS